MLTLSQAAVDEFREVIRRFCCGRSPSGKLVITSGEIGELRPKVRAMARTAAKLHPAGSHGQIGEAFRRLARDFDFEELDAQRVRDEAFSAARRPSR